ncbi:Fanconi anemia core complex-associated protein 20 [Leptodactylus fuscus]
MSEERSAKLKLKRKKCVSPAQYRSEAEVRLQPSSVPDVRQDFTGSWFDEMELTAPRQIWKQVLSSVYPDLSHVGWGAVPALPDVKLKMNQKKEEKVLTEVFKVGDVDFEWVALPSAFTIDNVEKPCVPDITDKEENAERLKKTAAETITENVQQRSSSVLESKKVGYPDHSGDSKRNTEDVSAPHSSTTNVTLPQMSHKSVTENVTKPRTLLKGPKSVRQPQTSHKGSSKNAKEPQTSQKGSTKHLKEPPTSHRPNINLWATVTSSKSNKTIQNHKEAEDVIMVDETSEGDGGGGHTAGKSADAATSLDKCPICLMQFPKQFSQLDMDSHLAQCLSETTVDVMW